MQYGGGEVRTAGSGGRKEGEIVGGREVFKVRKTVQFQHTPSRFAYITIIASIDERFYVLLLIRPAIPNQYLGYLHLGVIIDFRAIFCGWLPDVHRIILYLRYLMRFDIHNVAYLSHVKYVKRKIPSKYNLISFLASFYYYYSSLLSCTRTCYQVNQKYDR